MITAQVTQQERDAQVQQRHRGPVSYTHLDVYKRQSFTYAYVGFGTRAGFICGWALVLGYLCVIAANGTALALLSRFVLPGVFDVGYLYTVCLLYTARCV